MMNWMMNNVTCFPVFRFSGFPVFQKVVNTVICSRVLNSKFYFIKIDFLLYNNIKLIKIILYNNVK